MQTKEEGSHPTQLTVPVAGALPMRRDRIGDVDLSSAFSLFSPVFPPSSSLCSLPWGRARPSGKPLAYRGRERIPSMDRAFWGHPEEERLPALTREMGPGLGRVGRENLARVVGEKTPALGGGRLRPGAYLPEAA